MKKFLTLSILCFSNLVWALIGGTEMPQGMFPAQINFRGVDIACGGVVISSKHILTAAHCVTGEEKISIYSAGDTLQFRFNDDPTNPQQRFQIFKGTVKKIDIHESFQKELKRPEILNGFQAAQNMKATDLAIIEFIQDLPVPPMRTNRISYIGRSLRLNLTITGGGCLVDGGSPFSLIRYSEQQGRSDQLGNIVTSTLGTDNLKATGCYGDSGSPAYQNGSIVAVFRGTSPILPDGHAENNYFTIVDNFWVLSILNP
jgi:hypothetical protein